MMNILIYSAATAQTGPEQGVTLELRQIPGALDMDGLRKGLSIRMPEAAKQYGRSWSI